MAEAANPERVQALPALKKELEEILKRLPKDSEVLPIKRTPFLHQYTKYIPGRCDYETRHLWQSLK